MQYVYFFAFIIAGAGSYSAVVFFFAFLLADISTLNLNCILHLFGWWSGWQYKPEFKSRPSNMHVYIYRYNSYVYVLKDKIIMQYTMWSHSIICHLKDLSEDPELSNSIGETPFLHESALDLESWHAST